MIHQISNTENINTLHTIERIDEIVNVISIHNKLTIINKIALAHKSCDFDYSLMYVLDDCHIPKHKFSNLSYAFFQVTITQIVV